MDGANPPPEALGDEPSVLGHLPAVRPQHRSTRRRPAGGPEPARPRAATRRSSLTAAESRVAPTAPVPPAAPRSGWATPVSLRSPAAPQPPLVAAVDGALRVVERLVIELVRRLPRA